MLILNSSYIVIGVVEREVECLLERCGEEDLLLLLTLGDLDLLLDLLEECLGDLDLERCLLGDFETCLDDLELSLDCLDAFKILSAKSFRL